MDTFIPALPAPKRRRRHSPQFKGEVLKACAEPGSTIERYQLNANLSRRGVQVVLPMLYESGQEAP